MKKLKYPILKGKTSNYPKKAICPWCKNNKVFEPHSFAVINGGACLKNHEKKFSGPSDDMEGFLYFAWHGAHTEEGGSGKDPDTGGYLEIVNDVIGGQFGLYFCSTECLRAFLNSCVDELEQRIAQDKIENKS